MKIWLRGWPVLRSATRRLFSMASRDGIGGSHQVPVVIVGAGPVGLTLSILLSQFGVPSLLVERRLKFSEHPQAHFLNNRTMEIFRKMDGLAGEIEAKQPPVDQWRRFVYCTTLNGPVLGTVDHLRPEDLASERSPTSVAHFSQHHLLPLLYERAQRLGRDVHNSQQLALKTTHLGPLLMGYECTSILSKSDGAIVRISASQGGPGRVIDVACQYVVAADGAGSPLRQMANLVMEGEAELQKLISVHFLSKDLGQHLLATPEPGMLYFVFNSQVIAVVVAHNLEAGEFVAQIPFYPPQQCIEDFTKEVCQGIIQEVAGRKDLAIEVKAVKQWVMHAQVVDHYFDRYKNVILAGDAAHRFPPAGGFGLNTGVQDAHNLAWKLAAVHCGAAPRALLNTYETERQPVARANTALSVANFNAAMAVPAALGLDPSAARLVHNIVNNGIGAFLPKRLQNAVLDGIFAVGRAQVSTAFLSDLNPIAAGRVAKVQRILKEGHSLQLQFPAEDLGFRYLEGALVPEPTDIMGKAEPLPTGRRREYFPSTKPGARLPHFPIRIHDNDLSPASEGICSTLDLITGAKLQFVLIVGCNKSGCRWGEAALEAGESHNISVKVVFIWPLGSYTPSSQANESISLVNQENSLEAHLQATDDEELFVKNWASRNTGVVIHAEEVGHGWWELCTLPDVGGILVRPDEHIAWRSKTSPESSSVQDFHVIFTQVLGPPLRVSQNGGDADSPSGQSSQSNCSDDYAGIWCKDNGKYEFHRHDWYYDRTDKYYSAWVPCGCTYLKRGSAPAHRIKNIIFNESSRLS